jgi:hypothetical protein
MTPLDAALLFLIALLIAVVWSDVNDKREPPGKWRKF